MTTSLTAYTPLESLLLFQSLHTHGVGPSIFSRISDLLKNNPTVTQEKNYQSGRLSPDALRSFYLHTLKEEIKSEGQDGGLESEGQNGEVKLSRKRKAPSPSPGLPTVQEAAQYKHLMPKLVRKLYARYRAAVTEQIRDEEDRYERLQSELESIERGERDSELVERANGRSPNPRSPTITKKSPLLQQKPLPASPAPQLVVQDRSRTATPAANPTVPDSPRQPAVEAPQTLAPPNGQTPGDRGSKKTSPRKKPPTPTTPQPAPVTAPPPPPVRTPQALAPPPLFPQPSSTNASLNGPAPHTHQSPYSPSAPQAPNSQGHPPLGVPPAQSPSAPGHAPGQHTPPPTTLPPSAPQYHPQPIQPYAGNGIPQYGPSPSPVAPFSQTNQRFQGQQPPMQTSPGIQTPSQQRNLVPQPIQPLQTLSQQPQPVQPPPQGGFMLPPFQVSPQDPSRAHQPALQPYAQVSTPVSRPPSMARLGGSTATAMRQGLPPLQPLPYTPRSVVSIPIGHRSPYSAIPTPRSARTLWKPTVKSFPAPSVPRPEIEPIDDIGPLEPRKQSPPKLKMARKTRGKEKAKEKEKEVEKAPGPEVEVEPEKTDEAVPDIESRPARSRRRGATRRTRRGSITSSQAGGSVRERSRSQSIISHTETIAADTESQVETRVKSERGTSLDVGEEDSIGTPSQPKPRRRAGTIQASQPRGRKRTAREASIAESEEPADTLSFPRTVVATRQFQQVCKPVLDDITVHKHGSLFTSAVKAKDAEGYHEIIKRPTDIKSMRKAVTAGAKAVAAAASDTPAGSPGGVGSMLQVPLSADVIPPKAIVNSAQLEKELMRMFANAVMFNPGEAGVVEDAREMSEACQRSLSNWRSAERERPGVGRIEIEETPVSTQEDDAPMASKRRKI